MVTPRRFVDENFCNGGEGAWQDRSYEVTSSAMLSAYGGMAERSKAVVLKLNLLLARPFRSVA
jgi:hypothetical protein